MKTKKQEEREELHKAMNEYFKRGGRIEKIEIEDENAEQVNEFKPFSSHVTCTDGRKHL